MVYTGRKILPLVSPAEQFSEWGSWFLLQTLKGSVCQLGLGHLADVNHTNLLPGGWVGSCFSPRQDISKLI